MQVNRTALPVMPQAPRRPAWLMAGFWICVVIAIAVAVRRLVELARPSSVARSTLDQINGTFASHAALTRAHVVPAALFVVVAVIVLLSHKFRPGLEKIFFVLGAITGVTAYFMSRYAIGGWTERSAVLVFNTWFLFSLARAYRFSVRAEQLRKREWMTRSVGVLLGIATTRPVMGVFFATAPLTHLTPQQFFGMAFWIGFSINTVAIERWLHSQQRAKLQMAVADKVVPVT